MFPDKRVLSRELAGNFKRVGNVADPKRSMFARVGQPVF
jgi:hypothetical protein